MKVRTITIDEYDDVIMKALEAHAESQGRLNKERAYGETVIRYFSSAELCDLDDKAIAILYYQLEKLGSKHKSDWYKLICVDSLENDPIAYEHNRYVAKRSGGRIYKDRIIGVVI